MTDPDGVLRAAEQNIAHWKPRQRSDGMAVRYLERWEQIIADGVDAVADVLTGRDEASHELRQNSPFAGVLDDDQRTQVLRSFREHWNREHTAA